MSSIVPRDTDVSSDVTQIRFAADGWIPNNSQWPVSNYMADVGLDPTSSTTRRKSLPIRPFHDHREQSRDLFYFDALTICTRRFDSANG